MIVNLMARVDSRHCLSIASIYTRRSPLGSTFKPTARTQCGSRTHNHDVDFILPSRVLARALSASSPNLPREIACFVTISAK